MHFCRRLLPAKPPLLLSQQFDAGSGAFTDRVARLDANAHSQADHRIAS